MAESSVMYVKYINAIDFEYTPVSMYSINCKSISPKSWGGRGGGGLKSPKPPKHPIPHTPSLTHPHPRPYTPSPIHTLTHTHPPPLPQSWIILKGRSCLASSLVVQCVWPGGRAPVCGRFRSCSPSTLSLLRW